MTIINKIGKTISNRKVLVGKILNSIYAINLLSDKLYLSLKFRNKMGYWIDWKNPQTFSEKLQWLKLYNRRPEYTIMADKVKVKDWVAERIGSEYVIPTLGVWDNVDAIDFSSLPNKFVIKCNHNSGLGMYICRDKTKLNEVEVRRNLRKGLNENYFKHNGEWPYKNIPRRIIAEQYLENGLDTDLADYKFFCFDGVPKYCQVITNRSPHETIDLFDMHWNRQSFADLRTRTESSQAILRPANMDQMIEIVKKLADGIPFSRIDLHKANNKVYYGEVSSASEHEFSEPNEWNDIIGKMLKLPEESRTGYKILVNKNLQFQSLEADNIRDYKIFCFNGEPQFLKVDFNRFSSSGHRANYYDLEWNLLPFGEVICPPDKSHIEDKPERLDKMIDLAKKLATGTTFLRVDFYYICGHIYFGELTFFPASGLGEYTPKEYDKIIGRLLPPPHDDSYVIDLQPYRQYSPKFTLNRFNLIPADNNCSDLHLCIGKEAA